MTISNLWLQIHVLGNISKGIKMCIYCMKIYLSYSHTLANCLPLYIYLYMYLHTYMCIHTHTYM